MTGSKGLFLTPTVSDHLNGCHQGLIDLRALWFPDAIYPIHLPVKSAINVAIILSNSVQYGPSIIEHAAYINILLSELSLAFMVLVKSTGNEQLWSPNISKYIDMDQWRYKLNFGDEATDKMHMY